MKKLCVSFPGKTFLLGEYAVLKGGPALLVNTAPRFCFTLQRLSVKKKPGEKSFLTKIPAESPAGQFLKKHPHLTKQWEVSALNPYKNTSGFGWSSAQFNFLYWLNKYLSGKTLKSEQKQLMYLRQTYQKLYFKGLKPSGADVLSQWAGGVCAFFQKPFAVKTYSHWPFKDLNFFLIHTGCSLETWRHLSRKKNFEYSKLMRTAQEGIHCFQAKDKEGFIANIEHYAGDLEKQKLVHKNTLQVLKKIKKNPFVLTAKGCGAMGAEVIALFFHLQDKQKIKKYLSSLCKVQPKLKVFADSSHLSSGFNFKSVF